MPTWDGATPDTVADGRSIRGFVGRYRWLSNFHPCPVFRRGHSFGSAEAAYQAAKFPEEAWGAFQALSALESKRKARAMLQAATREERAAWDARKADVMRDVVWLKFDQNRDLAGSLIATADLYLEETNWWGDTFFGVCKGRGQNVLGLILMETRGRLGGHGPVPAPDLGGQLKLL